MSVKIVGMEQARMKLAQLAATMSEGSSTGTRARQVLADEVANRAREEVPVLTGETQASIAASPTGVTASGAGLYLEFGTSKMTAQPFMRPASDEGGPAAIPKVEAVLRAGIASVV